MRPENLNQLLPHHSFITLKQRLDIINGIKKGQGIHINQQKPSLEAFLSPPFSGDWPRKTIGMGA